MVRAAKLDGYDGKEVDDVERQWSVSGALLYSITVITTIGKHEIEENSFFQYLGRLPVMNTAYGAFEDATAAD